MLSLRNIRLTLAILIVTATIGILAAISMKGSKTGPPEPPPQQLPQNIDIALHNARFTDTRDGTVIWELSAERADYDRDGDVAYLAGIRMVFPATRSAGNITLTAAKGSYSSKTRNVGLSGRVHVVTGAGATFDTEAIEYTASSSRFSTGRPVTFRHERLTLAARGMTLDVRDQTARFPGDIDAVVDGLNKR